jgi:hypothetical protein
MMLYCDFMVNTTPLWYGVPCLNMVSLNAKSYLGMSGELIFIDMRGASDPTYDGLGTRYLLAYFDPLGNGFIIPLEPIPSQVVGVSLDGQECRIAIYLREQL